ncbi:MAG: tRNA threonylcarbamoyladenosine biosynthesis protein TsaE [Syntrophorhabdaceae bacterium PtaU1.Bin034]|jgi:tRNA threonylcarbamoyladenosine biosynthesis protein TsaE|nr:MAG: tRNA threonylcarbamoyladenosine biosynthesis protein TsaE [Syntrophorhabdaceae bacterium PtaU1.Bin034]
MERIEFISKSPSETIAIGEHIGKHARIGDLFLLYGELGAGKTQLVKGLAKGIGVEDWQYVLSPSFTLMNIYEGKIDLCHVDLYRLESGDVETLDIEDFLDRGIVAVEWAERFPSWQKPIRITLQTTAEQERSVVMEVEDVDRAQIWRHFSSES